MMTLLPLVVAAALSSQAAPAKAPILGMPDLDRRLAAIKPLHQWTSVSMRVRSGSFVEVSEPFLKINLSGSRWSGGMNLNGWVADKSMSFNANPFGRGWSLFGSGVNLTLSESGGGFNLWGSVDGDNVSLYLNKFGSGWSIWGQGGVNLSASGFGDSLSVTGSIDTAQFGARRLAALGAALAALTPR